MKKLKLKALELGVGQMLTRAQMKNVSGGLQDPGGSFGDCDMDHPCKDAADWCVNGNCKTRPTHAD